MKYFFSRHSSKMLIGSIIAGVIYGILGEILYSVVSDNVFSPVLTLFYFTGLFVWIGLSIYLIAKLFYNNYRYDVLKKVWVISFCIMLVSSFIFELIYDIIPEQSMKKDYKSYLFIIDNSSSMSNTDPEGLRYKAIKKLLEDKGDDFEYAVVSFETNAKIVRDMKPIKEGIEIGYPINDGATEMKHALRFIENKIKDGELKVDKSTRIVLLSDGAPTDVMFMSSMMKALRYYCNKGISISTVGLLYADDSFMQMIADKTGGIYVKCDDVLQLNYAIQEASVAVNQYRNLLGYRSGSYLDILFAFMRIIFVGLLGIVIALEKTAICDMFIDSTKVLVTSGICGILSGCCIELGMNTIGIEPSIVRIITCVLMSITFIDDNAMIFREMNLEHKTIDETRRI